MLYKYYHTIFCYIRNFYNFVSTKQQDKIQQQSTKQKQKPPEGG